MVKACSMEHMRWIHDKYKKELKMIDPTPNEITAARRGGSAAMQYADSIGLQLNRVPTQAEWDQFCLCFAGAYTEALAEFCRPPFPETKDAP